MVQIFLVCNRSRGETEDNSVAHRVAHRVAHGLAHNPRFWEHPKKGKKKVESDEIGILTYAGNIVLVKSECPPLDRKNLHPLWIFCIEGICLIHSWIIQILDQILWMEFQCTPLELYCFLHNLLDFAVFCTAPIEGIAFCPHGFSTMKTPPSPVDFQLPQMGGVWV